MIIGDANLFIHTQQNRRNAEIMASVRPSHEGLMDVIIWAHRRHTTTTKI